MYTRHGGCAAFQVSALPPGAEPMVNEQPAAPGFFFQKVLADQHYQKGIQLEQQGDWERALASYRRASSLDATNVLFLLARGHICQIHGLEPEAEDCYAHALRVRPGDTVVLYNQAQLFAVRGHLEAARSNLARIVAGGVDDLGDRAAPIYCRLGDLALRVEDYATAAIHFRKALASAPDHRYAAAALSAIPRFREFAGPFAADGRIAPKVALYGYARAILLGFPGDDGQNIPAYPGLGFESLTELAETLNRLVTLARQVPWQLDAVSALDSESHPLAIALGAALNVRICRLGDETPRGARCLAVTAAGSDPAVLREQVDRLRGRCLGTVVYAAGLRNPIWEYAGWIDVASVPVLLEYPWTRGEAGAAEHAEAFGLELAHHLARLAPDPSTAAQLVWYGRHTQTSVSLTGHLVAPDSTGPLVRFAGD